MDDGIEDVGLVVRVDVQVEGELAVHVAILVHRALDLGDGLT